MVLAAPSWTGFAGLRPNNIKNKEAAIEPVKKFIQGDPAKAALALEALPPKDAAQLLKDLPPSVSAQALENLPPGAAPCILEGHSPEEAAGILRARLM